MNTIIVEFKDDTMVDRQGVIINSHWSDAYGCWMLLLSCEDGPLRTVKSDSLGTLSHWVQEEPSLIIMSGGDDDDEDETDDE